MKCRICETRKARRYCPGVNGDICSICCGSEREVTVSCPLDCPYLMEARTHEKLPVPNSKDWPNQDVRITEEFLRSNERLLIFLGITLLDGSLGTNGVIDSDVREAIESLVRTYRTLESGLYYETRPANPVAAALHERVQAAIEKLRKELSEKGAPGIRDAELLGTLVFLQRIGLSQDNGRPRCRAFIDYLRGYFGTDRPGSPDSPSLITV